MACFGSNPDCCVQPQFRKLIDGFGHLDVKKVLSYLGVSGHDRFSHNGLGTHTLRSRREEWCIRVLWMHTAASAAGDLTCSHASRSMWRNAVQLLRLELLWSILRYFFATVIQIARWFNNCGQAQELTRWPLGGARGTTRPSKPTSMALSLSPHRACRESRA